MSRLCFPERNDTKRNVFAVDIKQIRVLRLRFFLQAVATYIKLRVFCSMLRVDDFVWSPFKSQTPKIILLLVYMH
jgi:hypothetical protein